MDRLDRIAAKGAAAAWMQRALSDCPAQLDSDARRAWRAGWRHGHDEATANREVYEAGIQAYGRGAAPPPSARTIQ